MRCLSLVGLIVFLGFPTTCLSHGISEIRYSMKFAQKNVDKACQLANTTMEKEQEAESLFKKLGIDQDISKARGPSHLHFGLSRYGDKYSERSGKKYGRLFECALMGLVKQRKYGPQEARQFVSDLERDPSLFPYKIHLPCPKYKKPVCNTRSLHYRTIDGSCNNLRQPKAGQAAMPFSRFLVPEYGDGVGSPKKKGCSGKLLNSARLISREVHTGDSKATEANGVTLLFMQWGQFLDHDITRTPEQAGEGNSEIKCCKSEFKINHQQLKKSGKTEKEIKVQLKNRDACFPIAIPKGDPHFSEPCMNFVRSMQASPTNCNFGFREQQNDITAYIDASNVYGSSDKEGRGLRELRDGLMKHSEAIPGQKFPPQDKNAMFCVKDAPSHHCFKAGDSRISEMVGLTSMHTLWVREHNRIAKELKKWHLGWNDEKLYQETRRIVGAFMQKITYADFLPVLLGHEAMWEHGIKVENKLRHFYGYNDRVDATIKNAFATAAFRVGHTFINKFFKRTSRSWSTRGFPSLRTGDHFFNPRAFYDEARQGADSILRGLAVARSQNFDRHITTEVTERLFETNMDGKVVSMDLAALNIQRGRDHGLPGYMEFRKWCGLRTTTRFNFLPDHDWKSKAALKRVYESVEDIDLFVGGISENQVPGSLVGPTFKCLIAEQFRMLKVGDRFYFENQPSGIIQGFSFRELREIKKVTLSRIYCNNVDIDTIQPNAFREAHLSRNHRIPCYRIPKPNLKVFDSDVSRRSHLHRHGGFHRSKYYFKYHY